MSMGLHPQFYFNLIVFVFHSLFHFSHIKTTRVIHDGGKSVYTYINLYIYLHNVRVHTKRQTLQPSNRIKHFGSFVHLILVVVLFSHFINVPLCCVYLSVECHYHKTDEVTVTMQQVDGMMSKKETLNEDELRMGTRKQKSEKRKK